MALDSLTLLDKFKQTPFLPLYPETVRTFYSPVDKLPQVLESLIRSASKSLVVAMFGFDDPTLSQALHDKLTNDHIYVQMSLDSTQAAGKGEAALLKTWQNDGIGNSIAIGQSEKHRIMHLKMLIIDGLDVVTGSTNWSTAGETLQDNQLTVLRDSLVAAEARARLDVIHDVMLKAMAAKAAKPEGIHMVGGQS